MLSLRGAKRRGNLLAAIYGTFQPNDTSQRLPRACGPRNDKVRGRIATSVCGLLAMTGLGDGLPRACGPRNDKVRGWIATSATPPRNDTVGAGTTVYRCHCEAPKGPWQSVPRAGSSTPLCSSKHARGREGQCIAEDDCQQRDGLPRACGPRNDKVRGRIAASACGLLAMTGLGDGLPRRLRLLAMTKGCGALQGPSAHIDTAAPDVI